MNLDPSGHLACSNLSVASEDSASTLDDFWRIIIAFKWLYIHQTEYIKSGWRHKEWEPKMGNFQAW